MFVDEFCQDFLVSLNPFGVQDSIKSLEESSCDCWFLFSCDRKLNDGTTGMEGFNDFVFIIAGEYKSAIVIERLNVGPK